MTIITITQGQGIKVDKKWQSTIAYTHFYQDWNGLTWLGNFIKLDAVINDLNDVGGTPSDGDMLTWVASEQKWKPHSRRLVLEYGVVLRRVKVEPVVVATTVRTKTGRL